MVEVGMPIEYELLQNSSRRQLERTFVNNLSTHLPPADGSNSMTADADSLKIYGTEGLFVIEGPSFMFPYLNQNTYYELKTVVQQSDTIIDGQVISREREDVLPVAVASEQHPAETLANLLLTGGNGMPDAMVNLDIHLSDYRREHLTVPVSKLRSFLVQEGCQLYFATTLTTPDSIRGMLLATNDALHYNHLLSVSMPVGQLLPQTPELQTHMYLFIPTIDKSKLFSTAPLRKTGAPIH